MNYLYKEVWAMSSYELGSQWLLVSICIFTCGWLQMARAAVQDVPGEAMPLRH